MHDANSCVMSFRICSCHAHVQGWVNAYLVMLLMLVKHIRPRTWDRFAMLFTGCSHLHGHMGQCTFVRFFLTFPILTLPPLNTA
ncbi:hypothetical protein V8C86DRAFT_3142630, partial [Haematococcus lacustris]